MAQQIHNYRDFNEDDSIVYNNGKAYATNKSELRQLVHQFIETEFNDIAISTADKTLADLQQIVDDKMASLEKEIAGYIEFKVDKMATSLVERMLTSAFEKEVNNRVQQLVKIHHTIEEKKGRKGNF